MSLIFTTVRVIFTTVRVLLSTKLAAFVSYEQLRAFSMYYHICPYSLLLYPSLFFTTVPVLILYYCTCPYSLLLYVRAFSMYYHICGSILILYYCTRPYSLLLYVSLFFTTVRVLSLSQIGRVRELRAAAHFLHGYTGVSSRGCRRTTTIVGARHTFSKVSLHTIYHYMHPHACLHSVLLFTPVVSSLFTTVCVQNIYH